MSGPRVLVLDIETSPDISYHWGRFKQNISLPQTLVRGGTICFAAKWVGERKVEFVSDYHDGHDVMLQGAHALLDEADAVVHYNGARFDEPHLNREFALADMAPPSPFRAIDLLQTARKRFRWSSNKLDNLLTEFGLTRKLDTGGFELWAEALDFLGQHGEDVQRKAWDRMRRYNRQDVRSTEELYHRIRPWIVNHPHPALYSDELEVPQLVCQWCGSTSITRRGYYRSQLGRYPQWQCKVCAGYSRAKKAEGMVGLRGVA